MEKHICEACGVEDEINPAKKPNFKCLNCGYEKDFLLRREMVDLNDPVEGPIALKVTGIMLRKDGQEKDN